MATSGPPALNWLTNLVTSSLDAPTTVDLTLLKPAQLRPQLDDGDLLELTIWDIYEPGKAHTFPVRVATAGTIEVPLLGEIKVAGRQVADVEKQLIDDYRSGELLLQPRVLVRELESPPLKVYVSGAVNRPGLVELRRDEAHVYAALVSAGGFGKNAGTHISVTRRPGSPGEQVSAPDPRADSSSPVLTDGKANTTFPETPLRSRANHEGEPLSVAGPAEDSNPLAESAAEGIGDSASKSIEPVPPSSAGVSSTAQTVTTLNVARTPELVSGTEKWYDISREIDRKQLAALQLAEGDVVTVKQIAPPVRITGAVMRPGSYPLPAGSALNVGEALQMAQGFSVRNAAVRITLTRPAAEDRAAQRWSLTLGAGEPWPQGSPCLQPGDVLHVESAARGRMKRVVGGLWTKSSVPLESMP